MVTDAVHVPGYVPADGDVCEGQGCVYAVIDCAAAPLCVVPAEGAVGDAACAMNVKAAASHSPIANKGAVCNGYVSSIATDSAAEMGTTFGHGQIVNGEIAGPSHMKYLIFKVAADGVAPALNRDV